MWPNPQETSDLVTFTEEILNGELHFLCSNMIIKVTVQAIRSQAQQLSLIGSST